MLVYSLIIYFYCFYCYMLQLVFFHLSSFMLMWILYSGIIALTVNLVLGYFLYMFFMNGMDVYNKLYVAEEDATTN